MRTIEIEVSPWALDIFGDCAEHFSTPLPWLLQAAAYTGVEVLNDYGLGGLERLEKLNDDFTKHKPVTLEFADETLALLERIAELLRWPLNVFLSFLIEDSAETVAYELNELEDGQGMDASEFLTYRDNYARAFHSRARRNLPPKPGKKHLSSCWADFELKTPDRFKVSEAV